MKIKKFKKIKEEKYELFFENDDSIVLYEDVIINNNLLIEKQIDENKLEDIKKQNNEFMAYNMALSYISIRMRSKKEIVDYLLKKGINEKLIEKIVDKLILNGFIDDYKFSLAYINDQMILNNYGPSKIKTNLLKHDIDINIINDAINNIDYNLVLEKLRTLIKKQLKIKKGSSSMVKIKLLNYFTNLGYEKNDILECLNEFEIKTDINILQKEYDKLYIKYKNKYDSKRLNYIIAQKLYLKGFTSEDIKKIKIEE